MQEILLKRFNWNHFCDRNSTSDNKWRSPREETKEEEDVSVDLFSFELRRNFWPRIVLFEVGQK